MNTIDTLLATDIQTLEAKQSENILTMTLTALRINFSGKNSSSSSSSSSTSVSSASLLGQTTTKTSTRLSKVTKSLKNSNKLPEITLEEVAFHDHYYDCWIVLYDRVYDVTEFLDKHPGGEHIILECAGRDATIAFRGTGHSKIALQQLQEYLIGELPEHQKIYRNTNGFIFKLSDIPD